MPPLHGPISFESANEIQQFRIHLNNLRQPGLKATRDSDGSIAFSDCHFFPFKAVDSYLRESQCIQSLLEIANQGKSPAIDAGQILYRFPKVLCILAEIGRLNWIQHFVTQGLDDEDFPLELKPDNFPQTNDTHYDEKFWQDFSNTQYMFYAHWFGSKDHDRGVKRHRILPITSWKTLDQDDGHHILKIEIHPDYNELASQSASQHEYLLSNTFVLKTYDGRNHLDKTRYESEIGAFQRLKNNSGPANIVQYFGSFRQHESDALCIILEFADCGNLENFFAKYSPPTSETEIKMFWERFFAILKAVQGIHYVVPTISDQRNTIHCRGSHQDIKLTNILVFSNGQMDPWQFTFKLADLGESHFREFSDQVLRAVTAGRPGTRTYGSPEAHQQVRNWNRDSIEYNQLSDIWSVACIISVASSWVVLGPGAVDDYAMYRKMAIKRLTPSEVSDCFHDGSTKLLAIEEWHTKKLPRWMDDADRYTRTIWQQLLRHGFEDVSERAHALQFDSRARDFLHDRSDIIHSSPPLARLSEVPVRSARVGSMISPTATEDFSHMEEELARSIEPEYERAVESGHHPEPFLSSSRSPPERPNGDRTTAEPTKPKIDFMSVDQLFEWKEQKDRGISNPHVPYSQHWDKLDQRDQVLLIDDSISMKPSWSYMTRLVGALMKFVKKSDKDGIEVYYTNTSLGKSFGYKRSSPLVEDLEKKERKINASSNPDVALETIFRDHKEKMSKRRYSLLGGNKNLHGKPLTIYFFTDGAWLLKQSSQSSIKKTISGMIDFLQAQDKPKKFIGIQFIHFGTDENVKKILRVLDSALGLSRDIVDVEPCDGNVWKMLLGAVDELFDDDETGTDVR